MPSFLFTAAAAVALAASPLVSAQSEAAADCTTIAEAAIATPDLSTLVAAVTAAGLVDALSSPTAEYTVFAPTNTAFAAVGTAEELTADVDALESILLDHVVDGAFAAADLSDGQVLTTLAGTQLTVAISDGAMMITAPGGGTVGTVAVADVEACASVVHIIDTVLLAGDAAADAMMATADADCTTIAEAAIATPDLSTLVAAVTAADLVDALSSPTPEYTVFAPTNAAFAAVGTPEELTADVDALESILLDHVVDGAFAAADLSDGQVLTTLAGTQLTVSIADGAVTITAPNGGTVATVAVADVEACASVVHIIDTVLLAGDAPADAMMATADADCTTIAAAAIATPDLSTLVAAVTAADLVDALSSPTAEYTVFAPTNAAFAAVGTPEQLTADVDALTSILLDHVVDGAFAAADLSDGQVLTTLAGTQLTVTIADGAVMITAPGGGTVGTVAVADVEACASVVHIIDAVLLAGDAAGAPAPAPTAAEECSTIVDAAVATPELSTLVAAVTAADLVEALNDAEIEYTVFAPTNEAFAAVGTPEELTADVGALTAILLDHVVDGAFAAADLSDGQVLTTLAGTQLTVSTAGGAVTITAPNGGTVATVAVADVKACASVVHVIDTVLLAGDAAGGAADTDRSAAGDGAGAVQGGSNGAAGVAVGGVALLAAVAAALF